MISKRFRARKILRKIEIQQNPESQPSVTSVTEMVVAVTVLTVVLR